MRFSQDMIFTGKENKISVKTQKPYLLVKLIEETGDSVSCICEHIEDGLKMLTPVRVAFELVAGKYISLKALDVRCIE